MLLFWTWYAEEEVKERLVLNFYSDSIAGMYVVRCILGYVRW